MGSSAILDFAVCRFCKSETKCKIITAEHDWNGKREVYSDMLMDCYGIFLSYMDGEITDRGVCGACVQRLRNALAFRQLVLKSEESFLQARLEENEGYISSEIKTEPNLICDEEPDVLRDDSMTSRHIDDLISGSNKGTGGSTIAEPVENERKPPYDVEIVHIKITKTKVAKNTPKNPGGKNELHKAEKPLNVKVEQVNRNDGDTPMRSYSDSDDSPGASELQRDVKPDEATSTYYDVPLVPSKDAGSEDAAEGAADIKRRVYKLAKARSYEKANPLTSIRDYIVTGNEEFLAENNMISIIESSYVCPFKHRGNVYYCFYCKDRYIEPEELRVHTWKHDHTTFRNLIEPAKKVKICFMDVYRIDCRLCSESIHTIDSLKLHIEEKHAKVFHRSVTDKFIQFRLTMKDMFCSICSQCFDSFKLLVKHMLDHYPNYVCHQCGVCYFDEHHLAKHISSHQIVHKYHSCDVCGKSFKYLAWRNKHVDVIHKKRSTVKCHVCKEMFVSKVLRDKHLTDAHGVAVSKRHFCAICCKQYETFDKLRSHQRSSHKF